MRNDLNGSVVDSVFADAGKKPEVAERPSYVEAYKQYKDAVLANAEYLASKDNNQLLLEMEHRFSSAIDLQAVRSTSVCLIGAGGLGNWVWQMIVGLGFTRVSIFDDDIIEIHNVAPQCHKLTELGVPKVESVKFRAAEYKGVMIDAHCTRVQDLTDIERQLGYTPDIIIALADNMVVRNNLITEITNRILNTTDNADAVGIPDLYLDIRMAMGDYIAYSMPTKALFLMMHNMHNPVSGHDPDMFPAAVKRMVEKFKKTAIFDDSVAVQQHCTARATPYCGCNAAAFVGAFMKWWFDGGRSKTFDIFILENEFFNDYRRDNDFCWCMTVDASAFSISTRTRKDLELVRKAEKGSILNEVVKELTASNYKSILNPYGLYFGYVDSDVSDYMRQLDTAESYVDSLTEFTKNIHKIANNTRGYTSITDVRFVSGLVEGAAFCSRGEMYAVYWLYDTVHEDCSKYELVIINIHTGEIIEDINRIVELVDNAVLKVTSEASITVREVLTKHLLFTETSDSARNSINLYTSNCEIHRGASSENNISTPSERHMPTGRDVIIEDADFKETVTSTIYLYVQRRPNGKLYLVGKDIWIEPKYLFNRFSKVTAEDVERMTVTIDTRKILTTGYCAFESGTYSVRLFVADDHVDIPMMVNKIKNSNYSLPTMNHFPLDSGDEKIAEYLDRYRGIKIPLFYSRQQLSVSRDYLMNVLNYSYGNCESLFGREKQTRKETPEEPVNNIDLVDSMNQVAEALAKYGTVTKMKSVFEAIRNVYASMDGYEFIYITNVCQAATSGSYTVQYVDIDTVKKEFSSGREFDCAAELGNMEIRTYTKEEAIALTGDEKFIDMLEQAYIPIRNGEYEV